MRNFFASLMVALIAALGFSSAAMGQAGAGSNNTLYNKLSQDPKNGGPGGPAPVHDLSGAWTALTLSATRADPTPPMTPLGQKLAAARKGEGRLGTPGSTSPLDTCDPLGLPRGLTSEIRGVAFANLPGRIAILHQYGRIWRDVWMDGRELPKNVDTKGGPESRWYGYSVGHWEGDDTLVVDTVGSDERGWNRAHSADALVEERYTRIDHNHMELSVTLNDPKVYTKPFVLGTNKYLWIPNQETEEQFCIPSEGLAYVDVIAKPAGAK